MMFLCVLLLPIWSLKAKGFGVCSYRLGNHRRPHRIPRATTFKPNQPQMSTAEEIDTKEHFWLGLGDSEAGDAEDGSEQGEEEEEEESRIKGLLQHPPKRRKVDHDSSASEDSDDEEDEEDEEDGIGEGEGEDNGEDEITEEDTRARENRTKKNGDKDKDKPLITGSSKLKPLSKEGLAASKEATAKTGVVYLSRIPVRSASCSNCRQFSLTSLPLALAFHEAHES